MIMKRIHTTGLMLICLCVSASGQMDSKEFVSGFADTRDPSTIRSIGGSAESFTGPSGKVNPNSFSEKQKRRQEQKQQEEFVGPQPEPKADVEKRKAAEKKEKGKKASDDIGKLRKEIDQLSTVVQFLASEIQDNPYEVSFDLPPQDIEDDDASVSASAFPWSKVHLSVRVTATNIVTLQGGSFWVGANAATTILTSDRTITADLQYLWLEYDFDANALTLEPPDTSLPVLNPSSPYFILPLAKFSFDGTNAAITDYLYLGGDYHLPGTWAR